GGAREPRDRAARVAAQDPPVGEEPGERQGERAGVGIGWGRPRGVHQAAGRSARAWEQAGEVGAAESAGAMGDTVEELADMAPREGRIDSGRTLAWEPAFQYQRKA